MNTLQGEDNQAKHRRKGSRHRGEISDAGGPLLVSDGQPTHEIEQHPNPPHDFFSADCRRYLVGPISMSLKLKHRVRPLLVRLDPTEREVRRRSDSIKPSVIYQPLKLPYLLHSIWAEPL